MIYSGMHNVQGVSDTWWGLHTWQESWNLERSCGWKAKFESQEFDGNHSYAEEL